MEHSAADLKRYNQVAITDLLKITPCPYRYLAQFSANFQWTLGASHSQNLSRITVLLKAYLQSQAIEPFGDGIAVKFPIQIVPTISAAGSLLHEFYEALGVTDVRDDHAFDGREEQDWRLHLNGTSYFCAFFGGFYPESHSRYSGSPYVCWMTLQTEESFKRIRQQLGITKEQLFTAAQAFGRHRNIMPLGDITEFEKILPPQTPGEIPIDWLGSP